jgi:hypothetical protein
VTIYSVDTSALFDGLERYYPESSFPALWARIDELIEAQRFLISEEVWEEARAHDAVAKSWCDVRGKDSMVVPTDASVTAAVQNILTQFPKLVANMKGRNRADAFVIAVARLRGAIVVTGEGSDGTENRPKIPYICNQLGIQCVRFLEIVRLEGWKF